MTLHRHGDVRKLSKVDWIDESISTLLRDGIDAVQITRLARKLGVSRGSFYWHFEDRQTLLDAMLDDWRKRNSKSVKQALEDVNSLSEGVLNFFSLWVDNIQFSAALEQSVRDWARLDLSVMESVHNEDNQRISHLAKLFERFGYAKDESSVRARVLYFAQIGYYAMHLQEPMNDRLALLTLYYTTFTGQKIDQKTLDIFMKKYGGS